MDSNDRNSMNSRYGLSITFFIIIGDQIDQCKYCHLAMTDRFGYPLAAVLKFAVGLNYNTYWYFDRRLMIVVSSILLIFPLCFSKTIKFLQIPR